MQLATTKVFLALIAAAAVCAQAQHLPLEPPPGMGDLESVVRTGDTLTLRAGQDTLIAQIVEPNILRVHYRPEGQTTPPTLVLDPNRRWRDDIAVKIDTDSDPIVISTERMIVKIS